MSAEPEDPTGAGAAPPPEAKPLPNPPNDGVSALLYLPTSSSSSIAKLLAATSWDGCLRIYDTSPECTKLLVSQNVDAGPLLSLAALSESQVVVGAVDGSIRMLDVPTSTLSTIGQHESSSSSSGGNGADDKVACSCLGAFPDEASPLIASAGWHRQFHLWDPRVGAGSGENGNGGTRNNKPVVTVDLPGKAFSMDVDLNHNRCVVATSGRRLCFVDVRRPDQTVTATTAPATATAELVLDRESSLKFATRTVRFFPDGTGLAVGSVEARVAVEYLEELDLMPASGEGSKKYAFKCHRVNDRVYPVNAIAFHPHHGTFATGGCDGTVVLWDGSHKKKLTTLPQFPTSIAALAFDATGTELAVAASYTFEEGEREHPRDEIYVRSVLDSECRPKDKS